jgi:hypothetical protein
MLNKHYWAEVQVNDVQLRLFSEENAQGFQFSVYDVAAKLWIIPSESADDIDDGMHRAAIYAKVYLKQSANSDLPPLIWKERSVQRKHEPIAATVLP